MTNYFVLRNFNHVWTTFYKSLGIIIDFSFHILPKSGVFLSRKLKSVKFGTYVSRRNVENPF